MEEFPPTYRWNDLDADEQKAAYEKLLEAYRREAKILETIIIVAKASPYVG